MAPTPFVFTRTLGLFMLLNCLCIDAPAQDSVSFTVVSIDCLTHPTRKEYLTITNDDDYQALRMYRRRDDDCTPLPEIDFDKKILIGYRIIASGCSKPDYSMVLKKEGKVHYAEVAIRPKGICSMIINDIFWFTIDKPNGSLDIVFSKKFVRSKNNG